MADSMEILLLSFLSIVLKSQWNLESHHVALITSTVFLGALVGTLTLGRLGDAWGRKPVFLVTASMICFFGVVTAATHHFGTLVLARFFVGFGVGGLTVPFDTLAEFVPTSHRGQNLMAIEYFWTIGSLMTVVVAYFTFGQNDANDHDWRVFVLICSIPCFLSVWMGLRFVPESPRWLLTQPHRAPEALTILRRAAVMNRLNPDLVFPLHVELHDDNNISETETSNVCDLLSPPWRRRMTLFLWATWAGQAFVYYGTIFVITMIFAANDENKNDNDQEYSFDYKAIFAAGSAEWIGTSIALYTIDRYGRIPSQVMSYSAGGLLVWILCILQELDSTPPRRVMILFVFGARLAFMCGSCTTWVSTAEMLTTDIRTTGHAAANAIARLGGATFPFLVNDHTSYFVIGTTILGVSLCAAWSAWHLPETAGKSLGTTAPTTSSTTTNTTLSTIVPITRLADPIHTGGVVETTALQDTAHHHIT
jgi:MFS transporter, putative metabolite:H+ symporter